MDIKKLDSPILISDSDIVRFKEMGNISEIMYSQKRSKGGYITKMDVDHYIDNRTGEIKEFEHTTNRGQALDNVAKSLSQGRDILNTNITDVGCCRWLTFTYAENMTNPKRLNLDFAHCVQALRKNYGAFEYITAAEPQGRGAWHLHAVFIFNHTAPYMPNDDVALCWKKGFVKVKKLDKVDNVGAYLTAYLGDMELSEALQAHKEHLPIDLSGEVKIIDFEDENGSRTSKKYIKGARLPMYPSGFHIFRWSKGIKKPDVSLISYEKAKEKVRSSKQTFSKTLLLENPDKDFSNVLQYESYNSIRENESQYISPNLTSSDVKKCVDAEN